MYTRMTKLSTMEESNDIGDDSTMDKGVSMMDEWNKTIKGRGTLLGTVGQNYLYAKSICHPTYLAFLHVSYSTTVYTHVKDA